MGFGFGLCLESPLRAIGRVRALYLLIFTLVVHRLTREFQMFFIGIGLDNRLPIAPAPGPIGRRIALGTDQNPPPGRFSRFVVFLDGVVGRFSAAWEGKV